MAVSDGDYIDNPALRAAGFTINTSKRPAYDFVCDEKQGESCVCHEALDCGKGPCITLEENVKIFREALAATGDRTVHCNRAEVGRCGAFSYFYFDGDIHRDEMRWFGPDGRLVAIRNTTDYNEYCGGASLSRWSGKIPDCDKLEVTELICGEARRTLGTPIEDVRMLTRF